MLTLQARTLSGRLFRQVILLSIIATIGVTAAIALQLQNRIHSVQDELDSTAIEAARTFDEFINEVQRDLEASGNLIRESTDTNAILRRTLNHQPAIFELAFVAPDGEVLAARRRVGRSSLQSFDAQPWLETTEGDQVYFGSLDLETYGVPFVKIGVPIHDEADNFVGTLLADTDLTVLWNTVTSLRVGENGYVYLTDADGNLLAFRDVQLIGRGVQIEDVTGQTPQGLIEQGLHIYEGLAHVRVIATAESLRTTPWFVVVEQPLGEILPPLVRRAGILLLGLLLVMFTVFSIMRYTRNQIVVPLNNLRDGVERFRRGDLDFRIVMPNYEVSEIGRLTSTLNSMAGRIEHRTQELVKANAVVKESARLKSEFMATMSHELRTPLNAMLGFSGIMLEGMGGEIDDEARHMVERIDSNSRRLLNLINDVLDLAKIEAGRQELVVEIFSPRMLVDQWVRETGVLAEEKGIELIVKVDAALPSTLNGDSARITQVAINLLSNAIKFTNEGNVTLELACGDGEWILKVSDTGIGIPPHALNYIFEEFRQVDGSFTRAYGGSGLGLAIVRSLCAMMDAHVNVESTLGTGSAFKVSLPLHVDTPDSLAPALETGVE